MNFKRSTYPLNIARRIFAPALLLLVINTFSFGKSPLHIRSLRDSLKNIYISVVPSKSSVYAGEALTVSYLLHYSVPVVDPGNHFEFHFQNAYWEEYPDVEKNDSQSVDNKGVHVVLIKKLLIIPRSPGPLNIPPIFMKLKADAPADGDNFEQDKYIIKSVSGLAKIVAVLPLPADTDSLHFSGAVGSFTTAYSFTKEKKSGNVLKVKLTITGPGDLKFARLVPFRLPDGLDIYNEVSTETHTLTDANLNSKITYSFDIVANYRGDYNLDPVIFKYFDPQKSKYIKFATKVYKWEVAIGPIISKTAARLRHPAGEKKARFLYIPAVLDEADGGQYYFKSIYFELFIIAGCLIFTSGLIYAYTVKSRKANKLFYNYKKARQLAVNSINKLETASGITDKDTFSKNLIQIFKKYLADRNFVPDDDFSSGNIITSLQNHNVPESTAQNVLAFLNKHQHLRFSLNKRNELTDNQYCGMLIQIINDIDSYTHV